MNRKYRQSYKVAEIELRNTTQGDGYAGRHRIMYDEIKWENDEDVRYKTFVWWGQNFNTHKKYEMEMLSLEKSGDDLVDELIFKKLGSTEANATERTIIQLVEGESNTLWDLVASVKQNKNEK